MLYATNDNGEKIRATPKTHATCPNCKQIVIAKCGKINIWHWAHKVKEECDPWKEAESEWHLSWKSLFPPECVEVPIIHDGKKHIADISLANGKVIEFQYSNLSVEEIRERERFYGNMLWIFNVEDAYEDDRLNLRENGNYYSFRWKHAKKHVAYATKEVFLDIGDGELFELKKIHLGPPCGGWGYIKDKESFVRRFNNALAGDAKGRR